MEQTDARFQILSNGISTHKDVEDSNHCENVYVLFKIYGKTMKLSCFLSLFKF